MAAKPADTRPTGLPAVPNNTNTPSTPRPNETAAPRPNNENAPKHPDPPAKNVGRNANQETDADGSKLDGSSGTHRTQENAKDDDADADGTKLDGFGKADNRTPPDKRDNEDSDKRGH